MKKSVVLTLLLLAGCVSTPPPMRSNNGPPMPPAPKIKKQPLHSPRAAAAAPTRFFVGAGPSAPPTWMFTNGIDGTYQIDASTNLMDWWPVAVVCHVTNVTITSDTVTKRPMMFYRVRPVEP